jgi:hypothetical protein
VGRHVTFSREDLSLLHETLAYTLRRTFSEGEKIRLKDLIGRVEERLLDSPDRGPRPFALTPPEEDALINAADTYCDALDRPFAAEVSRAKARRVSELVRRYRRRTGFLAWLARVFGRP